MLTRVKMFGVVLPAFALALVVALGGGRATAAADKNSCGCYRDSGGTCYCDKKAKCGCPGECEPKGCEEAREKQIQKEIDAETKKAADRERSAKASSDKEKEKEKASSDDESADNESDGGDKKAGTEVAPAAGKKLTVAQTKQLAKLIDAYLAAHPGNGSKSIRDVRSELK